MWWKWMEPTNPLAHDQLKLTGWWWERLPARNAYCFVIDDGTPRVVFEGEMDLGFERSSWIRGNEEKPCRLIMTDDGCWDVQFYSCSAWCSVKEALALRGVEIARLLARILSDPATPFNRLQALSLVNLWKAATPANHLKPSMSLD